MKLGDMADDLSQSMSKQSMSKVRPKGDDVFGGASGAMIRKEQMKQWKIADNPPLASSSAGPMPFGMHDKDFNWQSTTPKAMPVDMSQFSKGGMIQSSPSTPPPLPSTANGGTSPSGSSGNEQIDAIKENTAALKELTEAIKGGGTGGSGSGGGSPAETPDSTGKKMDKYNSGLAQLAIGQFYSGFRNG